MTHAAKITIKIAKIKIVEKNIWNRNPTIMNFWFHCNSKLLSYWAKCIRIHYCNFIQNMIMSEIWCYSYTKKIGCIKKFRNSSAKSLHCLLFLDSLTSIAMNCLFGSEDSVCGPFGANSTILLLVKCKEDMTSHLISLSLIHIWRCRRS